MKSISLLVLAFATIMFANHAYGTEDFCLAVRNTPDGFLALREGPGSQFSIKERLQPGETLLADTRTCMDSICDETRRWTFINHIPRLDGKLETAKHHTQGWVATKFTNQVPDDNCP